MRRKTVAAHRPTLLTFAAIIQKSIATAYDYEKMCQNHQPDIFIVHFALINLSSRLLFSILIRHHRNICLDTVYRCDRSNGRCWHKKVWALLNFRNYGKHSWINVRTLCARRMKRDVVNYWKDLNLVLLSLIWMFLVLICYFFCCLNVWIFFFTTTLEDLRNWKRKKILCDLRGFISIKNSLLTPHGTTQ